ncbi:MAG: hydantoinase/oxoprolinase N-terminal domain-containing protein [Solirubrobacteraceae bacterium]
MPVTALLVTRGFRDVLEIGSQMRPNMFDLADPRPRPAVPQELVIEVHERIDRNGEVVEALTREIDRVCKWLVDGHGVEACGISFIFSFRWCANDASLLRCASGVPPHLFIATSSEVCPEIKEYQASTTAISRVAAAAGCPLCRYRGLGSSVSQWAGASSSCSRPAA